MRSLLVSLFAAMTLLAGLTPAQGVVAVNDCPFIGADGSYHSATYLVNHRNLAGIVAFRIKLRGQSCVNRYGIITYVSFTKSAYVNPDAWNDWEWRSWWGTWSGGGVGYSNAYRRVQAHLELCQFIGSVLCSQNAYPYVSVTMINKYPWANGQVSEGLS